MKYGYGLKKAELLPHPFTYWRSGIGPRSCFQAREEQCGHDDLRALADDLRALADILLPGLGDKTPALH